MFALRSRLRAAPRLLYRGCSHSHHMTLTDLRGSMSAHFQDSHGAGPSGTPRAAVSAAPVADRNVRCAPIQSAPVSPAQARLCSGVPDHPKTRGRTQGLLWAAVTCSDSRRSAGLVLCRKRGDHDMTNDDPPMRQVPSWICISVGRKLITTSLMPSSGVNVIIMMPFVVADRIRHSP